MTHRTVRGLAALTLTSALLLSACSSSDDPKPEGSTSSGPAVAGAALAACTSTPTESTPTADAPADEEVPATTPEDAAALASVTVDGAVGAEPTVSLDAPFTVSADAIQVLDEGTGDELVAGAGITYQMVILQGADGSVVNSSWSGTPVPAALTTASLPPMLVDTLTGQKVGTRVLFAQSTQSAGADQTYVFVLEVVGTSPAPLERAEGEAQTPAEGLPLITLDETGKPSLEIVEGTTGPTELVAETLIAGTGATVESGQEVTFNYTGWTTSCEQFDSSWDRGAPFSTPLGVGRVIQGWDQGLVGKTVGSQVLLVIPKELAYGTPGSTSDLKDDDLIFLVDILAAS